MTQIVQYGQVNTTALIVPDLIVQIIAPQVAQLNGVPTNVAGFVGTATWGPVNAPTSIGSMADYARNYGAIQNRLYDMGTAVAAAVLQGANNFRCVRVTDGTDTAATVVVQTSCITFTGKYTGTLGNSVSVQVANGSLANSYKAIVTLPGQTPEVFDNITGTGNALWVNMANAINNGQVGARGPSQIIVATAGAGTTAPALATYNLASGTDGATTITGTTLVGVDTIPRKGMYALRGTGASVAALVDCSDTTTFSTQVSYGLSEGTYMIGVTPQGDTISNAVSTKATAGIDSYAFKYMFGDWVYFLDPVNGGTRLISPQGYVVGVLANLAPQHSSLNKQLYGIVGTQKSAQNLQYSAAELQSLAQAGIDVITNPIPAGNQFGVRIGHNSSSDSTRNGDNYTRMTNYLAATTAQGMGIYDGRLQSSQPTDPLRRNVKATLDNFYLNLQQQGQIDDFTVQCDLNNNPPSRIALGYLQADVRVRYLAVAEKILINQEGGQSVTISRQQLSSF
ncbi:phage tail protein [Ralstonia sp. TCR112]|uniref:phage tail sheath C-terminal domain-containing protein n=1 Tax=Ralstonia sp. TCR112 TaxID=2601730 RepID=UPI0011BF16D1|nr:phage tail sheath C-terminal domain-containing protein [Ralstonia sp. TCR112]TXD58864.1 phage tail protein [Ralstonia sp. TCR112]